MFGEGWYTHQIFLTQLSELLKLLGHQKLSTSNSTPHFPKDYKEKHRCSGNVLHSSDCNQTTLYHIHLCRVER